MPLSSDLLAQVAAAFQPENAVDLRKLSTEDESFLPMKRIEALFTGGVDLLRKLVPNPRIQALGSDIWQVFEHRHVVLAVGPPVPSLSFAVLAKAGVIQALLLAPDEWDKRAVADPIMQLGAIVMTGSQAVDFYNGRFLVEGRDVIVRRSLSYEAEYLLSFGPIELNDYQKKVLQDFPAGFDPSLDYVRKPILPKN